MRRRPFSEQWLRSMVLGISAAPLVLSGCGRTAGSELELHELGSVIPSKDGGAPDAGIPDAGQFDAGQFDAGPGCESPTKAPDAGWLVIQAACSNEVVTMHHGLVNKADRCQLTGAICEAYCGGVWSYGCHLFESPEPSEVVCWQGCVGRLIEGATPRGRGDGVAGALANMAAHEGAAALAFDALAGELSRHAMPRPLVHAARRAAREERRHTRLVGALARAGGGVFAVSHQPLVEPRTLEAIALENASEGCVRETLGAMVGLHQARHARDANVRRVMARVSADELGHAAWSHALAETLNAKLPLAARRRVREAREAALSTAASSLAAAHPPEVSAALGMPDEERLHALAKGLRG